MNEVKMKQGGAHNQIKLPDPVMAKKTPLAKPKSVDSFTFKPKAT